MRGSDPCASFSRQLGGLCVTPIFHKERGYYRSVIFIRNTVETSSLETESALDVLCCDNEGKGVNKKIRGASVSLDGLHLASASFYLIGWGTFSACENCQMSQIGSREARIWGHRRWQCFMSSSSSLRVSQFPQLFGERGDSTQDIWKWAKDAV